MKKYYRAPIFLVALILTSINLQAGWQYKQAISLSSTGTALTDYQVLVTLTTGNFTYAHANADGSDIRFSTDGTGASAPDVDYWIESWNTSGDSKIWIEVPSIPSSGGATVYLYYGNAGASSAASGDNTFIFFDDFAGSSLNTNKWTVIVTRNSPAVTISDGIYHASTTNGQYAIRTDPVPFSNNIIIENKMAIGTITDAGNNTRNRIQGNFNPGFDYNISDDSRGGGRPTAISYFWNSSGAPNYGYGSPITNTTLYPSWLRSVHKVHDTTMEWATYIYTTDVTEFSKSGTITASAPFRYALNMGDASPYGGDMYIDWVFVRQYTSTEPSVSFGSESSAGDASLPIELSSFTARQERGKAVLEWITESETDNLGFVLERRRPEAGDWTEIASYRTNPELQGQGSATDRTEYEFIDQTVEANTTYEYRIADVSYEGIVEFHLMATLSMTDEVLTPMKFGLKPAYPNPFNPWTTLPMDLAESGLVSLAVYDLLGRHVATIIDGFQPAGEIRLIWNAEQQPAGMYLCVLRQGRNRDSQKLLLLK